jgi:hypothetical protein
MYVLPLHCQGSMELLLDYALLPFERGRLPAAYRSSSCLDIPKLASQDTRGRMASSKGQGEEARTEVEIWADEHYRAKP